MKICVLGSKHRNVDLSLNWYDEIPYLANYELLIINTITLNGEYFKKEYQKFRELKNNIFNMLMIDNKKVIIIYGGPISFLPICPVINKFKDADILSCTIESHFFEYIKNITHSSFYIEEILFDDFFNLTKNLSAQAYPFAKDITGFNYSQTNIIKNKGNYLVGTSLKMILLGESYNGSFTESYKIYSTGEITFLPPSTNISTEENIDLLLQKLIGIENKEIEPVWIDKILLPNLGDIEGRIYDVTDNIQKEREEIKKLEKERSDLTYFRNLLWTKGPVLEKVVLDSLIFLGFDDLSKIRSEELEDGVFKFKTKCNYELGILEIKGSDNRTSLANLTQCNKWVEDYLLDNKNGKGVFITNQNRLKELSLSISNRSHFEPNELEYAKTRKICIIPTFEIFNVVILKLNGDPSITREAIEEKIIATDGLFKLK